MQRVPELAEGARRNAGLVADGVLAGSAVGLVGALALYAAQPRDAVVAQEGRRAEAPEGAHAAVCCTAGARLEAPALVQVLPVPTERADAPKRGPAVAGREERGEREKQEVAHKLQRYPLAIDTVCGIGALAGLVCERVGALDAREGLLTRSPKRAHTNRD